MSKVLALATVLSPINLNIHHSIIAVHGLNGHAFNTWAMKKTNVMWLRDFLPRQIPEARIMTYGYNSKVSDSIANGSFRDFSVALLNSIDLIRTKEVKFGPLSGETVGLSNFVSRRELGRLYLFVIVLGA